MFTYGLILSFSSLILVMFYLVIKYCKKSKEEKKMYTYSVLIMYYLSVYPGII